VRFIQSLGEKQKMIRYLTPRDREKVIAIRLEALSCDPDAFGATLDEVSKRSDADWDAWISKVIVPEEKNIIVIEEEGRPVAMCGFGVSDENGPVGFLWGMFVSRAHRRKSYGRRMLNEAEVWLKQKARTKITACVAAPNDHAVAFYRRCGFTVGPVSGVLRPGSVIPIYPIEKEISAE
jgi:ribosomal protein S18 acetylase RimI-like enzyme